MDLTNKIAVVAGATRGAGRAMAVKLGEAGATVYVTGRTTKGEVSPMQRKETIEETAEMVKKAGGNGIPVKVDHTDQKQVERFINQVNKEQNGRLDILVNDVWGGDPLTEWGKDIADHDIQKGLQMQKQAVHAHLITAHYAVPLMKKNNSGLIVEITDGIDYEYRGNFYYSLAKISNIHMAKAMAEDLKDYKITSIALTPGFLRSEAMLDHFGVTEENWMEGTKTDQHFIASESPFYIGEALKHLACDPDVRRFNGSALSTWELSEVYNFKDIDGRQPHWGKYFKEHVEK
ncbi:SDR family oxidoreductase [Halobacillus yeomjeoni]|uniref:SDR family NAD(P)-dependent oxidoreductase n=1 Tax=Halobacillus yeomjeoni TaxID=311194 RepID=A0A931MWM3_9BACI|nr:SDR family oxidoreductase [Halobacillus yeomjeoni]MBH0231434.1 SDR family NAD(P)-dependent oxidoreductase [Halobacillus yeomjeoni]